MISLCRSWSVAALFAIAGCAAQDCDPNRADLFAGIGCSVGGGYATRTQGLQAQYQAASANAQSQSLAAITAEQEAQNSQDELRRRQAELADLDRSTGDLRRRLAIAKRQHTASAERVRAAETQLAALTQERQTVGAASSPGQIDDLKRQQQKLADILSQM